MTQASINRIVLVLWCFGSLGLVLFMIASSPADRAIAWRTLALGLESACFAVPLGCCLAWVSQGRGWIARLVFLTTLALLIVPVFLHVSTWDAAFGRLGWLTSTRGQVLIPLVSGWSAASWIHGVAAAPQVAVLVLIGLSTGQRTFEEQALLDTTSWGVFWNVTVYRLFPLLLLSLLWTMLVCAREIAATDLYQIGTLAEQIYLGFSLGQINALGGNWTADEMAAAGNLNSNLTLVLIVWLAITATLVFTRMLQAPTQSEHVRPHVAGSGFQSSNGSNWLRRFLGLVLLLLLLIIPMSNLILRCGYYVRPVDGVPTGNFSLSQLAATLNRAIFDYTNEFTWSALIAVSSATFMLVLATSLSWLARKSRLCQILFLLSLATSFAVPGPMMGVGVTRLFTSVRNPTVDWFFDRTILAPVLTNSWFCWPLAALVVWFLFRSIPYDLLEQAEIEGVSAGRRFWRFGVLDNRYALLGCGLISMAFCFGELSASQLVLPPGIDTVPRTMLGLLHAGVDEMTAALTIVMVGGLLLLAMLGWGLITIGGFKKIK